MRRKTVPTFLRPALMYNWASSAYRGEKMERAKEKEGRREKVEKVEENEREGERETKVGRKQLP